MVGGGGDSLKTSDAGGNVFNEVVVGHIAFRRRGLGGPRRTTVGRKGTRGGETGGGVTKWSGVGRGEMGGERGEGKEGREQWQREEGGPPERGEKWKEYGGDCGQWK